VAGRALVFSHPEIVRLLQTRFVPFAGDQWYLHRQEDADGAFFWKVARQGYRGDRPEDETRQGIYAATPDGALLGSLNSWSPEKTLAMLRGALASGKPVSPSPLRAGGQGEGPDPRYHRAPPPGGVILNVYSRIPLGPPGGQWTPNRAVGRDHLWLTREEAIALRPPAWHAGSVYPVPPAIATRLVRFHLVDNVRGEPDHWRPEQIREALLSLTVADAAAGRVELSGTAQLAAPATARATSRGYDARLQGTLVWDRKRSRLTRCDLLAWGEAWGEGTYTGGAPPGRFPLLIALSLAGNAPVDRVAPQGSRSVAEYLGTGRAGR
jgi:hypothetical protein